MAHINQELSRRPLKSRQTRWAAAGAKFLLKLGLKPNSISILSIVFAGAGGALLWAAGRGQHSLLVLSLFYLGGAVCIQLRLLCNLFDGMVAIEGGLKSKSGEIYNELPDRFADALFLAGAGYSIGTLTGIALGFSAALCAVITAYARALGVAAGAGQQFIGPMAKPQRMALLTVACVLQAIAVLNDVELPIFSAALAIIIIGCVITIWRRTRRIISELESR